MNTSEAGGNLLAIAELDRFNRRGEVDSFAALKDFLDPFANQEKHADEEARYWYEPIT